ncbi:putative chromatin regulator PHD family [Dioscorea sansibarensis]
MAAICQTCGSTGYEELLIFCSVCGISAEHAYCGYQKSENWKCELCEPRDPKILSSCRPKFYRCKKRSVKCRDKGTYCSLEKVLLKKPLVDYTGMVAVKQADSCHVSSEPTCQFRIVDTSQEGSTLKIVDASNVVGFSSEIKEDKNFRKPRRRLVLAEEDEIDEDDSQAFAIPPTDENFGEKVKSLQSSSENNENANVALTDNHDFDELERSGNLSSGSDEGKKPTKHRRRLILPDDDQLEHEQIDLSVQDRKMEVVGALESKETCKNQSRSYHLEVNETYVPAMPIINHVWRGNFNISNDNYGPFSAHLSNKACMRVWDSVSLFPGVLQAEKRSRLDIWPNSFKVSPPNDHNIALYFFPCSERADQMLNKLLEDFITWDIALKVTFDNSELLIFTSTVLPEGFQRFRGKFYLWGVFRGRKDLVPSRLITEEIEEGEIIDDPKGEVYEEVTLGNQNDDTNTDSCLKLFPLQEESIAITARTKIDDSVNLELQLGCSVGNGAQYFPPKHKTRILL